MLKKYWWAIVIALIIINNKKHEIMAVLGVKQNNPLNLEKTPASKKRWQGELDSTNRFAKFDTIQNGVRANLKNMRSIIKGGKTTVAQLINTWAPPVENNVSAYYKTVSKILNDKFKMNADAIELNTTTPETIAVVAYAMAHVEVGASSVPALAIFHEQSKLLA